MRKNILTTAMIIGGITAYAGSYEFKTSSFSMELFNGETIEVAIQQELPVDEYAETFNKTSKELIRETLDHEKMLQLLNKIRKVEQEVKEELPI